MSVYLVVSVHETRSKSVAFWVKLGIRIGVNDRRDRTAGVLYSVLGTLVPVVTPAYCGPEKLKGMG